MRNKKQKEIQRKNQRKRIAKSIKLIRSLNEAYNPLKKTRLMGLLQIASNYPKIK